METRPGNYIKVLVSPFKHILSITEANCLRMIHNQTSTFSQLVRDFLLRVTPNSARVDSSNINPQEFWNFGINCVALNYQTPGLMMDLQVGSDYLIISLGRKILGKWRLRVRAKTAYNAR